MGISVKPKGSTCVPVPTRRELGKYKNEGEWRLRNLAPSLANNQLLKRFCESIGSDAQKNLQEATRSYQEAINKGQDLDQSKLCEQVEKLVTTYWNEQDKKSALLTSLSPYLTYEAAFNVSRASHMANEQTQRYTFSNAYTGDLIYNSDLRKLFSSELNPPATSMYCMPIEDLDQDQLRMIDKVIRLQLENNFNGIPENVARKNGIAPRGPLPNDALKKLLKECLVKGDEKLLMGLLNSRLFDPAEAIMIGEFEPEPEAVLTYTLKNLPHFQPNNTKCFDALVKWVQQDSSHPESFSPVFKFVAERHSNEALEQLMTCDKYGTLDDEDFNEAFENVNEENFDTLFNHRRPIDLESFRVVVKNSTKFKDTEKFRKLFTNDLFNQLNDHQLGSIFFASSEAKNKQPFRILFNSDKFSQIPAQYLGMALIGLNSYNDLRDPEQPSLKEDIAAFMSCSRHREIPLADLAQCINQNVCNKDNETLKLLLEYERASDLTPELLDVIFLQFANAGSPGEAFDLLLSSENFKKITPYALGYFLHTVTRQAYQLHYENRLREVVNDMLDFAQKILNSERAHEIPVGFVEDSVQLALSFNSLIPSPLSACLVEILTQTDKLYELQTPIIEDVFIFDAANGNIDKIRKHIRSEKFNELKGLKVSNALHQAAVNGHLEIVDEIIKSSKYQKIHEQSKQAAAAAALENGNHKIARLIEDSIERDQKARNSQSGCVIS